jgi:hypothetical protein
MKGQLHQLWPVELIPWNQNERQSMVAGAKCLCADILAGSDEF